MSSVFPSSIPHLSSNLTEEVRSENRKDFRAGYVAIVGAPNAGKSTLMNAFLGQKLSIVSNKPQTTRHRIMGILTRETFQIIFQDTPGLLDPKYKLHEAMMRAAQRSIDDADAILYLVDVTTQGESAIKDYQIGVEKLKNSSAPVYLVLNKTDLSSDEVLKAKMTSLGQGLTYAGFFAISALQKQGTDQLLNEIGAKLPPHPAYYPPDYFTDHPERFFVSEIVREKIFEQFLQEIPYSASVDIVEFKEVEGEKDLIQAEIYVERPTQKGILIGKKGAGIKKLGEAARKDIQAFLGRSVRLELHVKVREQWREDKEWIKRLGYE
jgi:GTP-binding protein Era